MIFGCVLPIGKDMKHRQDMISRKWNPPGKWYKKLGLVLLVLGGLLSLTFFWQNGAARRSEAQEKKLLQAAWETYPSLCAPCHGNALEGRELGAEYTAPPLVKTTFRVLFTLLPSAMENWIREQIDEGTGVPTMPIFHGMLSPEQISALAFLIRNENQHPQASP